MLVTPFHCLLLRKSPHRGEALDPDVLRHHRSILTRLAEEDGISIPPENIVEEVISGERLAARPEFAALLSRWQSLPAGTGGRVYCMEADRISRGDQEERGIIYGAIIRAGLLIRTPSGLLNPTNPDENLLLEVKGSLARHELERFKQRVARIRNEQLRQGQVRTGRVPFGYTWDRNTRQVVPHPEKFPILVRCCREALTKSIRQLAREHNVNEERLWYALTHPLICGWPARRHDGPRFGGHPGPRDTWEWPEKPGSYPAACTRAEWEAIQQAMQSRKKKGTKPGSDTGWCRDVLRFAGAPGPVRLGSARRRTGEKIPLYEKLRPGEPALYVRRDLIHPFAAERVREALGRPQRLAESLAQREEEADDRRQAAVEAEVRGLRADMLRLLANADSETDGEIAAGWSELARQKSAEIKERQKELQRLQAAAPASVDFEPLIDLLTEIGEDWEEFWGPLPVAAKRLLVNGTLAYIEVTVTPGKTCWHWRREITDWAYQPWI